MKKFILLTLSIFLGVSSALFLYRVYDTHIDRSPTIRYSIKSFQGCYVDLKNGKYYHKSTQTCRFESEADLDTKCQNMKLLSGTSLPVQTAIKLKTFGLQTKFIS